MKKLPSFLLYSGLIGSILYPGEIVISSEQLAVNPVILAQVTSEGKTQTLEGVDVSYTVTERWNNGYKVQVNIAGNNDADSNWLGSIYLPQGHKITENYGVLISDGTDKVNFTGDFGNNSLDKGEEFNAVLIVEGNSDGEINIGFDGYRADLGKPVLSSFTEEERQQWGEQEVAQTASEDNQTETDTEKETASEDNQTETDTEEETASEDNQTETAYQNFDSSTGEGKFNYGEALQLNWLLLMANRSGEMGEDNRLEWRSDSTLNDGSDQGKDLTGGYFDAGDHIKFIQPMAYTISLLSWSGVDYKEAYEKSGQLDELLNAVKQGTDYFLKSHELSGGKTNKLWVQVGDKTDHDHWVPPEKIDQVTNRPAFAIDPNNPGSDAAAGTASALASASMLFADTDTAYSQKLLDNAIALYDFAETNLGKYSDSVEAVNPFYTSWSGYEDELVLGAIWLYRATGDSKYLEKAEQYFKNGIGHIGTYTYGADDHSYAALALLAKESSDSFFKKQFQDWMGYWLNAEGGVKHSAGGLAIRAEWASAPLALASSFLAEWYSDFVEPNSDYSAFAQKQLDYLLGENPNQFSYVIGFGDNYPVRPHHRGSADSQGLNDSDTPNDHLLIGALVGGPRSDDNSYQDRRDDWVTNEVGTSYNAPLAATAIQQYDNHGGEPMPDEQLAQNFDEVNNNISDNIVVNDTPSSTPEPETTESVSPPTDEESENSGDATEKETTEEASEKNNENGNTGSKTAEEDTPMTDNPDPGAGAIAVGFENHGNGTKYSTDVQKNDWDVTWSAEMDNYASITNEDSHSGNQSLKIAYPSDRQSTKGAKWMLEPQKEYYLSYWVKFDDDFDFDGPRASGGKLPGLGQGELCSGGMTCDGNNGFTSRYMWRENGQAVLYLYHMDKPDVWGEDIPLGRSFERGKWHHMVQRVKVNDSSQANGEIEIWMDGAKVLTRKGLRLTNGQGIDTAYFSTFHGGSGSDWWPDKEDHAYFDDFVVSPNAADVGL